MPIAVAEPGNAPAPSAPAAPLPAGADAFARLEARWSALAAQWLPGKAEGSIWRHSAAATTDLPPQGWKLHVSATILSAADVLETIAPLLTERGVPFKGPAALLELKRLNVGLFYGYTQIGKAFTVYPRHEGEACELALLLDAATAGLAAVPLPFERPVRRGSAVFARYGAFRSDPAGGTVVLKGPRGEETPDSRLANPPWAVRPAALGPERGTRSRPGPLATRYRVYEALSQRGKGGVFRALDLTVSPLRLCVVKEGRRNGEVDLDRSDGRRRIRREAEVLLNLAAKGLPVPAVYDQFVGAGNRYLVIENVEGETLAARLAAEREALPDREALRLAQATAGLVSGVHAAGWAWRDIKPNNFMLTAEGALRPIDFEGAARLHSRVNSPWGTAGYLPPEWRDTTHADPAQDVHALAVMIHQIFTRILPAPNMPLTRIVDARPALPPAIDALLSAMTAADPAVRPDAHAAKAELDRLVAEALAGSM